MTAEILLNIILFIGPALLGFFSWSTSSGRS